MASNAERLVGIAERYDRQLEGLDRETLKRISDAYDISYRTLIDQLREAYPRLQEAGSVSSLVQQGAIAAELREALEFINPGNTEEYRRLGETVIQQSLDLGQRLAGDSLKRLGVQSTFTTIPLDAVRFQAERFTKSLVNYSNRQAGQISAVVEQGLIQGWGVRKTEQGLKALGVSFKSNAETIARTEIQSAYVNSSLARYEKAGVDKVVWISTPSDRLCSLCAAKNGLMYKAKDVVFPPHPRCVVHDTSILSPTIHAGTSRQYTGQIITIQTASGKKLTATPNHPILTDKGWVALNLIKEGDNVISSGNAQGAIAAISPDYEQRPALIGEVVASLNKSAGVSSVRMKVSPIDFHGDGEGSDVCVISPNRLLRDDRNPSILQHLNQDALILGLIRAQALLSQCLSAFGFPAKYPASNSIMRGFELQPFLFGRHLFPFHQFGFRLTPAFNVANIQNSCNCASLLPVLGRDSILAHALNVITANVVNDIGMTSQKPISSLLPFDFLDGFSRTKQPAFTQNLVEGLTTDLSDATSILNRLSGQVQLDPVINVTSAHFDGPVYNIETSEGWYFANSIVTHNCRCTTLPAIGLTAEDAEYYKNYREQTLQELKDAGGKPDNGLAPFEKAAGLTSPPKPVWEPGNPLPKDVGMPQPPAPPLPAPKTTTAKPTLKGDASWNPHAKTDLTPGQFREYVEARYAQINQNNPRAAHNQTWEEYKANNPSAKKSEYQSAVKDAIRYQGYVPSEAALSGVKLGKPEQAALAENRNALEARGRLIADMDLAINAPILPGNNSSGWSPQMSRADAAQYLEDSYFGTVEFYHGNQRRVTDNVAEEGAKPWLNSRGIYGQGTYFGVDPSIGREYAKAASQGNTVDVGIVTTHIKAQNPYVVTAAELDQLAQSFPGTQSNGSDSPTMTAFLRARGYDSVYLTDLGYGVAFDQRQVVTVENQRLTRDEVDAIEVDISLSAKDMVADDNESAILLRSRRSTVIEGEPFDEEWMGLGEIDSYNPNGFDDEEDW